MALGPALALAPVLVPALALALLGAGAPGGLNRGGAGEWACCSSATRTRRRYM